MAEDLRLPTHPRGRAVTLYLDGKPHRAFEGETVGAALHADGVDVLSRSIKYHRPRGLFCCRGECANCLVRVDGRPNVRACMTPVADGMRVESQNAFPSARRDLLGVVDKVYRRDFDPKGAYLRPAFVAAPFRWVVRRMAGFGRIPDARPAPGRHAVPPRPRKIRRLERDVVVVGAGAAGLAAASAAATGERRVLVLEAQSVAGGGLLHARAPLPGWDADGPGVATRLVGDVARAGGDVRLATPAVGRYPDEAVLTALAPDGLLEVRCRDLVVATGSQDVPPLFPGNDLPGILSARGALTLLHRDGVRPGRVAVVVGEGREAATVADALRLADVKVAEVAGAVAEAQGATRIERVVLADGRKVACDTLVAVAGRSPRPELVQQAGCAVRWDGAALVPVVDEAGRTSVPGVWACGEATGAKDVVAALDEGLRTGKALAEGRT